MKILVFSEEYIKITKGMFVVWVNQARETSKRCHVDILLNNEHWAIDEVKEVFHSSDKGPEFIAKELRAWLSTVGVKTA